MVTRDVGATWKQMIENGRGRVNAENGNGSGSKHLRSETQSAAEQTYARGRRARHPASAGAATQGRRGAAHPQRRRGTAHPRTAHLITRNPLHLRVLAFIYGGRNTAQTYRVPVDVIPAGTFGKRRNHVTGSWAVQDLPLMM